MLGQPDVAEPQRLGGLGHLDSARVDLLGGAGRRRLHEQERPEVHWLSLFEAAIIARISVSRPGAGDGVARALGLQSGVSRHQRSWPTKAREVEDMAVRIG